MAVPTMGGPHIEVLEVDTVATEPRGEIEEPQGEADDLAGGLLRGDECIDRGLGTEEGVLELLLGRDDFVTGALVFSQLGDHRQDLADVGWLGTPDGHRSIVANLDDDRSATPVQRLVR